MGLVGVGVAVKKTVVESPSLRVMPVPVENCTVDELSTMPYNSLPVTGVLQRKLSVNYFA